MLAEFKYGFVSKESFTSYLGDQAIPHRQVAQNFSAYDETGKQTLVQPLSSKTKKEKYTYYYNSFPPHESSDICGQDVWSRDDRFDYTDAIFTLSSSSDLERRCGVVEGKPVSYEWLEVDFSL